MDALRRLQQNLFSADDEEGQQQEDDLLGDYQGLCNLSPIQRIYGFGGCLLAGLVFMLLSLVAFVRPIKFALLFTFGNVAAVGSTTFIIGPTQQFKMMFDGVRVLATAIYVGCVLLALICALLIHNKILTLIAIIVEICALTWYGLSYIPFARKIVSDMFVRVFDTEI
ncbi:Vesicle transport protein [Rhynchospora pubera]|uniref:Vesicle transport protein n=1 Tax=Rhynchospora pubera TaxID=906938 RepID=A0AAV8CDL8_9POAL|nr:Vesicle transport protein [Rhynchospora pubera]